MSSFSQQAQCNFVLALCAFCAQPNGQRQQTCNRVTRIFFKLRLTIKLEKCSSDKNFKGNTDSSTVFADPCIRCRLLTSADTTWTVCPNPPHASVRHGKLAKATQLRALVFFQHAQASNASEGVSCKGYGSHRDKDLWCR